ncbi:MAG: outer membrane protein assembly factor BamA [Lentisphaerae bacterium GWF2_44_16]|nr:MAG: outer membrane protein assembly factor BamA [Lentisphaerae bacterium GWF2_44_16]
MEKKSTIKFITVLAALMLFAVFPAFSEEIDKIIFEQAEGYTFPDQMLFFNIQLKSGENFDEKILNEDIKRLYSTGFFSDVVSETSKTADGKINIIFKTTAKPRIKSIIFEGNKKFSSDKLMKEITMVTDVPLNDAKLKESAAKLRKFYLAEGYNDATVMPEVRESEKGYLNVVFKIDEHLKLKIDNVIFEGATVYSGWKLRHTIANQYSYFSWLLDVGLLNRNEFQNDKLRLRELYWNKGYLDFKVESIDVVEEAGNPEYVNITFKLFEGEPYVVGSVKIIGNKEFTEDQILEMLRLTSGNVYDNRTEKGDVEAITDRYASLGYADFSCRVVRIPDYKTHIVNIEYHIREGVIYTVNDVNISGNKVTKDKIIRRELAIQPGDPVDKNRIEASKSRLMGMGYFEEVETMTVNSGEQGKKDISFNVKEKSTAHFKVGGGFSDTDSLLGMVELSQTNFDITDPENYFQGGGQRVRAQAFIGLKRYDFNINFMEPWLMDMPLKLDVNGYLNNVIYEYWQEQRLGIKASLAKKFFDEFTTVTAGYRFENVRVHKMESWMPQELLDAEKSELVGALSLGIARDTRDSLTDPTSGYLVSALSELSSQALGGAHNYYRLEARASQYCSLLDKALIFHFGGKIGTVSDFNRSKEVPLYERYFLGGGDSIRGFPWRNVSPTADADGEQVAVGGQSMLLLTSEMTHPIWEFIRGAVFIDAGNAWKNSYSYGIGGINIGAGYGLRIKMPYVNAPVAIDLAYPILNNQDGYKSKFRVHFNMGFSW